VGIFTHPQNRKITSNSDDNDPKKLRKIAELLKGSPIGDEQWNIKKKAIEELDKLLNKIKSEVDILSIEITVENLIDNYKGINWTRLLNGLFRETNIKLHDLVQVQDHQYLLQFLDAIRNQTNE
jgi:hypothetical protein